MSQEDIDQPTGVGYPQATPVPEKKSSFKKPLIIIGVLLGFGLFGISGYILGTQRGATSTKVIPTPTITPSIESSTRLLEPNLVPMNDWQTVSFPQNIIVSQGGETRPGKIELKVPSDWTAQIDKSEVDEETDGVNCNIIQVMSSDKDTTLVIKASCRNNNNDYLPISEPVSEPSQKVELVTKMGNDGYDSYTVRYYDVYGNVYHYGSISVSPGASIDIQKDEIYPKLTIRYEPDRYEQWLWTTYDLTYGGPESNQQNALNTADTIVSTLKLTD
jgi:hypothetical protein